MENFKIKTFLNNYAYDCFIFFFLFGYFAFWFNFNFQSIESNNNSLEKAIEIYNYKPLLSYFIDLSITSSKIKIFLGSILLPSLVGLMLYKIFNKILNEKLWSLSLTLLSIFSTESYPFIKYLAKFVVFSDFTTHANKFENFEIIGFPIPSFGILYFLVIFFLTYRFINLGKRFFLISTFFWVLGIHIHPIDGLIGLIYWTSFLIIFVLLKKIKFSKFELFTISLIYIVNLIIMASNIQLEKLNITTQQYLPMYNVIFYFLMPTAIIIATIKIYKVDFYEFLLKFSTIYLLMIAEIILILLSLIGFGIELQMLENRITLFFLHYLYYVPIIYYLSKDKIFYEKSIEKNLVVRFIKNIIYYTFNKYKSFYLIPFTLILILYAINSLNI